MRKFIVVFIGLMILTGAVNAQKMSFGIVANPHVSWMKPDITKVEQAGAKVGLNFGLNADFFFAKNYAFHTGLLINNSGGRLDFKDSIDFTTTDSTFRIAPGSTLKYKLQYIDIPLGLKFKTKQLGYFTYFGQLGITAQVRVSARGSNDDLDINDAGISDEIGLFSVGYHIGGGIEYSLGGTTALMAGIKYTNGFVDVTKDKNKISDKTVLNSVSLQIGILF
jgi:Outer membrane protein beta-barrel domain